MHAAGERAAGLNGGDAVVTATGRAVTTDTVVRAAGIAAIHPVRLVDSLQPLQYFFLTQLQLQPPATSQATVFFSHTTPAPASSSSLPNGVSLSSSPARTVNTSWYYS